MEILIQLIDNDNEFTLTLTLYLEIFSKISCRQYVSVWVI